MSMTWKTRLNAAIRAELAAEKTVTQAEDERRRTWWETTWALADVPRPEWGAVRDGYAKLTGHSKQTADNRRRTGGRLTQTHLAMSLPTPRFAEVAANWIGKDGDEDKVAEAIKLLADAEADGMSLREFHTMLTGRSWTATPENLTDAEEEAIARKVLKDRPETVLPEVDPEDILEQAQANARAEIEADKQRAYDEEGYSDEEVREDEEEMAGFTAAVHALANEADEMKEPVALGQLRKVKVHLARILVRVRKHPISDEWRQAFEDTLVETRDFLTALDNAFTGSEDAEGMVIEIEEWLRKQQA